MKQRVLQMVLWLMPAMTYAQGGSHDAPLRSIYVEVNGPNIASLNFDSRLRGHSGWGYRVGIGYNRYKDESYCLLASGNTSWWNGRTVRTQGVSVPLEVNYLLGRRQHKFEAGAGVALGIFRERVHLHTLQREWWTDENDTEWMQEKESDNYQHSRHFGYYAYVNVGYRLQTHRGFLLRLGTALGYGGDEHTPYRDEWSLRPYAALGYTLPAGRMQMEDSRQPTDTADTPGYRAMVEAMGGVTEDSPFLAVSTSHGYRFNSRVYLGGGLALTTDGIPLFAHGRFNLMKTRTAPLVDVKGGYNFGYLDSPLYLSAGVGINHRFRPRRALGCTFSYFRIEEVNGWTFNLSVEL